MSRRTVVKSSGGGVPAWTQHTFIINGLVPQMDFTDRALGHTGRELLEAVWLNENLLWNQAGTFSMDETY